jgi:hypothetical protein
MEAIFGHVMATRRFAVGSGEPLGVNQAKSVVAKADGSTFNHVYEEKTTTEVGERIKATELLNSTMGGKRKESTLVRMRCF